MFYAAIAAATLFAFAACGGGSLQNLPTAEQQAPKIQHQSDSLSHVAPQCQPATLTATGHIAPADCLSTPTPPPICGGGSCETVTPGPEGTPYNCVVGCTPPEPVPCSYAAHAVGRNVVPIGCRPHPPVSYQGPATPGKQCLGGGGASSAPIGMPLGGPDTGTGKNGDEINNVYLVNVYSGSGTGTIQGNGGFFLTTFSGQVWYEPPTSFVIYNGPIFVNMGNISVSNNGTLGFSTLENDIANALQSPSNSGLAGAAKNAVANYLKGMAQQAANVATPDCFSSPWNGQTTV